jgi:hypothetical protein
MNARESMSAKPVAAASTPVALKAELARQETEPKKQQQEVAYER